MKNKPPFGERVAVGWRAIIDHIDYSNSISALEALPNTQDAHTPDQGVRSPLAALLPAQAGTHL